MTTTREGRPNLSPEQELRILELDAEFKTQRQIAEELGIAQSTVSVTLARLSSAIAEDAEFLKLAAQIKIRYANRYEHIAREAMIAWGKSKEPKRQLTKREGTKRAGFKAPQGRKLNKHEQSLLDDLQDEMEREETFNETTAAQEDRAGNPAFLTAAMSAMDRVENLLGLKAPARAEHTIIPASNVSQDGNAIHKRIIADPEASRLAHEILERVDAG